MLQNVFHIALLHIKLVLGNRSVLVFSLIMPILFTAFMSNANMSNFGERSSAQLGLQVVDEDASDLSRELVNSLRADSTWTVEASGGGDDVTGSPTSGRTIATLRIPAGFGAKAVAGQPATLDFEPRSGTGEKAQSAEQFVRGRLAQVNLLLDASKASMENAASSQATASETTAATAHDAARMARITAGFARARESFESVSVTEVGGASAASPSGAKQSSPGMVVMFALLFMVSGTNILIFERQIGTLRRLLVMPMSRANILLGKFLGIYIIGIVQMSLLILAGMFLFGVNWGHSISALVLMILSFALVAGSMGMLLATMVSTIAQADALASMLVMSISALGGAWWPLEGVPRWMNVLGHAFPTAWAMDGFNDIITRNLSVGAVLPEVCVLLLFTVVFLGIGIRRFRYV